MTDHLLPTTVVGSYPQPDWLLDRALLGTSVPRVRVRELWRVREPYLTQAQDDATLIAIRGGITRGRALALSLVAAPYQQTYDFLVCLPAINDWRGVRFVLLLAGVVVVIPWLLHFIDLAIGSQLLSLIVPWLYLVLASRSR